MTIQPDADVRSSYHAAKWKAGAPKQLSSQLRRIKETTETIENAGTGCPAPSLSVRCDAQPESKSGHAE
jgi:hypothetical protein